MPLYNVRSYLKNKKRKNKNWRLLFLFWKFLPHLSWKETKQRKNDNEKIRWWEKKHQCVCPLFCLNQLTGLLNQTARAWRLVFYSENKMINREIFLKKSTRVFLVCCLCTLIHFMPIISKKIFEKTTIVQAVVFLFNLFVCCGFSLSLSLSQWRYMCAVIDWSETEATMAAIFLK